MLLALICGNMNAGTIVFGELGLENGVQYLDPFDGGDFTVTFAGGGNDGKYYTTGAGIRVYGGGSMAIAAKSGTLTKVVITYDGTNKPADGTVVDNGTYDAETGIWTGSGRQVTFVRPSGSGHWRVKSIEATVEGASTVTIAAPTISGTTPFVGSTEVSIANNEEGASVFYTIDGTDPTGSSTAYSAPFTVTETTTVKAIAIKGDVSSSVASKTFTAVPTVANIEALNKLQNNDLFAFAGEALVVYVSGKYAYIKDDTGSSLVFDNGITKLANLAVGKKIAANWMGKVSIYNKLFEAVPDAVLAVTEDAAVEVTYPEAKIEDVKAENMNQVVVLKDVIYTAPEGKNFNITKEGIDIVVPGYNQFGLEIAAPEEGKTYHITGVISVFGDKVQFQPIAIQEGTPAPKDVTIAPESGDISEALEAALAGAEAKSVTINLKAGAAYTITKSIISTGNVAINGNGATVDASALTVPMIQMSAIPAGVTLNAKDAYEIGGITIKDVTITGLPYQLIYGNKQKYLMAKVLIDDCVIGVNGTNKKTIIDFNGGGNASEIIINNSTLWANPSNATNGGLFSSQSGHGSIQDLGSEKQLFAITNSTIYNIASGKTTSSQRRNSTAGMEYKVENSIIVNSGKSGQFIVGLNGGNANAAQTYTISGNAFNFGGADVSAAEQTKVQEKVTDKELNSVEGVIAFTDADNGDFNGTFTLAEGATKPEALGDARWTIEFKETPTGISTAKVAETQDAVIYNVAGQKVNASYKGLMIMNGRKFMNK